MRSSSEALSLTPTSCPRSVFAENPMNIGKPEYTHDACQEMAAHMMHAKSLPAECKKYKDVMSDLQRRDSDTTHPSQVLS